jgi:hypothetical protein
MANDNQEEFVMKRLRTLEEPEGFAPNAAWARNRLRALEPDTRRWVWKVVVAAAMLLLFGAIPAARAIAQTGTLSPEAFSRSFHETILDVHWFLYYHFRALQDWWNN